MKLRNALASSLVLFLVACAGGCGGGGGDVPPQAVGVEVIAPTRIVGYSQTDDSITLEFDQPAAARYAMAPSVPLTANALLEMEPRAVDAPRGKSVTIPIQGEPTAAEYSIVVWAGDKYVEIVRQSDAWLQKTYSYARVGGFSILGRRTMEASAAQADGRADDLPVVGLPIVNVTPEPVSAYDEINLAAGLLHQIWDQPIQQGPTTKSYLEFLSQPLDVKMDRVRTGDFAVSCTGLRDLFAHASLGVDGLKVRLIEATNYAPQLPDLITYGHSTAEVWVEGLGRWVLFDPWLGIIVMRDGEPIGASELAANSAGASAQPIIDSVPRMYREDSGLLVHNSFAPDTVDLTQFSCSPQGCSPGYSEYFKNVVVRGVVAE